MKANHSELLFSVPLQTISMGGGRIYHFVWVVGFLKNIRASLDKYSTVGVFSLQGHCKTPQTAE